VEEFNVSAKLGYDFNDAGSLELGYDYYDDRRGEGYKDILTDRENNDIQIRIF
jgi:hypothetical protein